MITTAASIRPRRAALAPLLWLCVASHRALGATEPSPNRRHAIIFDAGSSGTRIHVYTFVPAADSASGSFELIEDELVKTEPGLSSYAREPERAGASLDGLLSLAMSTVPAACHGSTPVHLLATAGLRTLGARVAAQLLDSVRAALEASPFLSRREWVSILDGDDEALFGWTTVNYLLHRAPSAIMNYPQHAADEKTKTNRQHGGGGDGGARAVPVGVIDLGGSSVQLAAPVDASAPPPRGTNRSGLASLRHAELGGAQRAVHVVSTPAFGLNDARARAAAMLDGGLGASDAVAHPCLPAGYNTTSGLARAGAHFVGTADFAACRALMRALMTAEPSAAVGAPTATPDRAPLRPSDAQPACAASNASATGGGAGGACTPAHAAHALHYYGFSYLFDRTVAIGLRGGGGGARPAGAAGGGAGGGGGAAPQQYGAEVVRLEELAKGGAALCALSKERLEARYHEHAHLLRNAHSFCADVCYLLALLEDGYGFAPSSTLTMANVVDGVELVWTLGAMINYAADDHSAQPACPAPAK